MRPPRSVRRGLSSGSPRYGGSVRGAPGMAVRCTAPIPKRRTAHDSAMIGG